VSEESARVRAVIEDFLVRANKRFEGWSDETGLWGSGLGLDSLDAAELSATLEDELGSDPFSAGGAMPESVGDILAFYNGRSMG
jgi:acyl carrier protein